MVPEAEKTLRGAHNRQDKRRLISNLAEHPIIALWSHPRSMSTATERVMRERGDLRCFHEPFMYLYYVGDGVKEMPHFEADEEHPTSYEDIRAMLLSAGGEGPVFFKDMSYYVLDRMTADEEFARRLTNTFLIRDPAKSILSFYRKDPGVKLEEIGLEAQWRHFEWLTGLLGAPPPVMDAADIQADPAGMIRAWCDAAGLEFLPHSLEWDRPPPPEWEKVSVWHGEVIASQGLGKRNPAAEPECVDTALDSAPQLRAYYEHHVPFYEALRKHRLAPARE